MSKKTITSAVTFVVSLFVLASSLVGVATMASATGSAEQTRSASAKDAGQGFMTFQPLGKGHHAKKHHGRKVSTPVLLNPAVATEGTFPRCTNYLVRLLVKAGFRGENVREAWAISMRESGGNPEAVSETHDLGLFQFNRATYGNERWWDSSRLLKRHYNARMAYRLSEGGKTWSPWGLDGHGNTRAHVYESIWTRAQIEAWITKPYQKWYGKFPC